jgi:hypothetical protein
MPQKTKAEIAAEKAALKESWEVVKLENEFDRAMNEGKDPNPFDVKAKTKKRSKGGGMDMGQMPNTVKPEPRGNPGIVENVVGKGGDYIKDLID